VLRYSRRNATHRKLLCQSPRRGERSAREARIDLFKLSTKWRRKQMPLDGDFERALSLASSGWIFERDGMVVLTEPGQEIARRSRVGHVQRRSPIFDGR
jgi:hypothetical protein